MRVPLRGLRMSAKNRKTMQTSRNRTGATQAIARVFGCWLCIAGLVYPSHVRAQNEDVRGELDDANEMYRTALDTSDAGQRVERFRRAMLGYQEVIDRMGRSATASLYVNLGNAAVQADEIGRAVLAFNRALYREPGNDQAFVNLEQTRRLLPEWCRWNASRHPLQALFFWNNSLTRLQVDVGASLLFLVGALFLAMRVRTGIRAWAPIAWIPFALWGSLIASGFARTDMRPHAVILPTEVVARSADSHAADARFDSPLVGGTEVLTKQVRGEWVQVSVAGKSAWVPRSALAWVVER